MNILVIDDETMIREMLQQAFQRLDFNVDVAENATTGISKFDNGCYDLVITDVRMPGVDGHTVVHHIRHSKREFTPVIGVSGTPWLLQNQGFNEVFDKPFSVNALIEKARGLVNS